MTSSDPRHPNYFRCHYHGVTLPSKEYERHCLEGHGGNPITTSFHRTAPLKDKLLYRWLQVRRLLTWRTVDEAVQVLIAISLIDVWGWLIGILLYIAVIFLKSILFVFVGRMRGEQQRGHR